MASSTITTSAAVTPAQKQAVENLVTALRQKNDETRHKAARDLFNYVSVDLREIPADNLNEVLDHIIKTMLDTVKGDASAKLGGVLAIVALINALLSIKNMLRFQHYRRPGVWRLLGLK